jgi:hypothetical protein
METPPSSATANFSTFQAAVFECPRGGRVARLENGHPLPSTKTLLSYAKATGSRFHVRLSAA